MGIVWFGTAEGPRILVGQVAVGQIKDLPDSLFIPGGQPRCHSFDPQPGRKALYTCDFWDDSCSF